MARRESTGAEERLTQTAPLSDAEPVAASPVLSRREFFGRLLGLGGAGVAALVLAGCAGEEDDDEEDDD
jgi:hypothetical protein